LSDIEEQRRDLAGDKPWKAELKRFAVDAHVQRPGELYLYRVHDVVGLS
jgi:hypothetical protein